VHEQRYCEIPTLILEVYDNYQIDSWCSHKE